MEKQVVISIKGMQKYVDTDPDVIELVTEGRLIRQGKDDYILSYRESELTAIRIVMSGRMAGLDGDTIRARLRRCYC